METIINLGWFVGIVVALYFAVNWLWFKRESLKAIEQIEEWMGRHDRDDGGNRKYNTISYVKALLLIRGKYLPKELRVAAENWVEEMEEKSKGK